MIKLFNIVGARPQIIKSAAVHRAIRNHFRDSIEEIIIHTGQHYDHKMSQVFFEELGVPKEHFNLEIGSSSHARQTAGIMTKLEELLNAHTPDAVLVYGDTNSTIAAGLAAAKLHVPVIHVEAGLRSFNKFMPEEINRVCCDHVSTLLFAPTETAVKNLKREGFAVPSEPPYNIDHPGVFLSGDVMYDNTLYFGTLTEKLKDKLAAFHLQEGRYVLITVHRENNTDDPARLNQIFESICNLSEHFSLDCVIPLHPRTSKILPKVLRAELAEKLERNSRVRLTEPLSFLEMSLFEKYAQLILTDSGGVQKEAFFHKKPCIILRSETEWVEIAEAGGAILTDTDPEKIFSAVDTFLHHPPQSFPACFGDGNAAEFICKTITGVFS